MKALRVKAHAIPVPMSTFSVFAASQVAWVTELRKSSGVQTQSIPASSAELACSASSAGRVPDRGYGDAIKGGHAQSRPQTLRPYCPASALPTANVLFSMSPAAFALSMSA